MVKARRILLPALALLVAASQPSVMAAVGEVKSQQKIGSSDGNFTGHLDNFDSFGSSSVSIGDFDGDGVGDIAVGALGDGDGGFGRGAVWLLYLNANGTVKADRKISDTEGGFTGTLGDSDRFGTSVTSLGDLDGDGVGDIAVGATRDDDGGFDRGAVWILFLNSNGTVKAHQKISDTQGGFGGTLSDSGLFGSSLAALGDLDGDGVGDIVVGAVFDDDGGANRGAVWILFLNSDGTVKAHQKISDTAGGFAGVLDNDDRFGIAASLGDLNGDGVVDIAVGATRDDDGGENRGAVWILFLDSDGTVTAHQKISDTEGAFTGELDDHVSFGASVGSLGDLDGDGIVDVAVGAPSVQPGGSAWVLFLEADGTVASHRKIGVAYGNFTGTLGGNDSFGSAVASLGDLDGDAVEDLLVGGTGPDNFRGAVWVLFLDGCGNGSVNAGEQCDDGNDVEGDGCDSNCTASGCGNGIVSGGEQCDDGNGVDECDGCSNNCTYADICGSLYGQTDKPSGEGVPNQDWEAQYTSYDSLAADDFKVTFPTGWDITEVATTGTTNGPSLYVNIWFYPDDGGRPALNHLCAYLAITDYTDVGGSLDISLPEACHVAPGVYWVAQQVRQDFYPSGIRRWSRRLPRTGNEAVFRNPGNEYGCGTDWIPITGCFGFGKDLLFELSGSASLEGGGGVPAVGPLGLLILVVALGGGAGYILTRRR